MYLCSAATLLLLMCLLIPESRPASNTQQELSACIGVLDQCQCSSDHREFSCRAAGFLTLPDSLPSGIVKLWVWDDHMLCKHVLWPQHWPLYTYDVPTLSQSVQIHKKLIVCVSLVYQNMRFGRSVLHNKHQQTKHLMSQRTLYQIFIQFFNNFAKPHWHILLFAP